MMKTRAVATLLAAFGSLGTGCLVNLANDLEDAIEELELDGPFEAELDLQDVDAADVRAGLFVRTTSGEITGADGAPVSGEVELDVDITDGRVDAFLPGGATAASLQPLEAAEIDGDSIVFTLPDLDADTELVAIAWVDGDGDGALDLAADGPSEAARTLVRDHEGAPHYLTYYSYDAAEGDYSATAVGDVDGTTSNLVLSRDQLDGWTIAIDRASDDPR